MLSYPPYSASSSARPTAPTPPLPELGRSRLTYYTGHRSTNRPIVVTQPSGLFLPNSAHEFAVLQLWWPAFDNTLPSLFSLDIYRSPEFRPLPIDPRRDELPMTLNTFYPQALVNWHAPYRKYHLCLLEASDLFRALSYVQRSFVVAFESPNVAIQVGAFLKAEQVLAIVERSEIRTSLTHFRRYWYQKRNCPSFAILFLGLFSDFCEACLSPEDYERLIFDETRGIGIGLSKRERQDLKSYRSSSRVTALSIMIPYPLDLTTLEGQLLIAFDRASRSPEIVHPQSLESFRPQWEDFPFLQAYFEDVVLDDDKGNTGQSSVPRNLSHSTTYNLRSGASP
ncbi:MAG: hypothetical protein NXY57DRAFT_966197 [Lentinula lateritia]|nr:MAG: hypothetical protein NXY57DRAFT_966197 [Lentinula lateritia]